MELSDKKDLLLGKRRIMAMFPFLLINFVLSIVMIVFSAIPFNKVYSINEDYQIKPQSFDWNINENEEICKDIKKKTYDLDNPYRYNFSHIFGLYDSDDDLEKFEDYAAGNLAFSISSVSFLALFIGISLCFCPSYICVSDEVIKDKKEHFPNKKHPTTTCFFIFKIITFSVLDIYLIAFFFLTRSINSDIFERVYFFHDNCFKNESEKDKFRNDYTYCWEIDSPLDVYYVFTIIFLIIDFVSIVVVFFAKNYNIWSFILSKISCGKYTYKEIDYLTGFIIPQKGVFKDNDYPDKEKDKMEEKENQKKENLIRNSDLSNINYEPIIGAINDD